MNFEKLKQRIDNGEKVWIMQTEYYKRIVKIGNFNRIGCPAHSDICIRFLVKYPDEINFCEEDTIILKNDRLVPKNKLPKWVLDAVSKLINSNLQKAKESKVNWDLLLTDVKGVESFS